MPAKKPTSPEPRSYHHGDLRQALIGAGLALVTEEQDWSFSLREVARRAGVSHNAPYNHFAEKRDLLGAVAAVGFEMLRDRMLVAMAGVEAADTLLKVASQAYVGFAAQNPALYRLMFGPALADKDAGRPDIAEEAGAQAKEVLERIIFQGAKEGLFAVEPDDRAALGMATLACWSTVHGLSTLIVDAKAEAEVPLHEWVNGLTRYMLDGLRQRQETTQ